MALTEKSLLRKLVRRLENIPTEKIRNKHVDFHQISYGPYFIIILLLGSGIYRVEFDVGSDCEIEITSDATPALSIPPAPNPSYTTPYSSISVAENEGTRNYTIALNIESTAKIPAVNTDLVL